MRPFPAILLLLAGCGGGGDCLKVAEKKLGECPDGFVPYGRTTETEGLDLALADLVAWASLDTWDERKKCEIACVPATLGTPDEIGECDAYAACGGDLVGDWRWQQPCPYEVPVTLVPGCSTAVQTEGIVADGTLTFGDDGAVSFTATRNDVTKTALMPPECVVSLSSCDQLDSNTMTCAGTIEGGCACTELTQIPVPGWSGTYTASNGVLTITRGGVDVSSSYCIDGDRLILDTPFEDPLPDVREALTRWIH